MRPFLSGGQAMNAFANHMIHGRPSWRDLPSTTELRRTFMKTFCRSLFASLEFFSLPLSWRADVKGLAYVGRLTQQLVIEVVAACSPRFRVA